MPSIRRPAISRSYASKTGEIGDHTLIQDTIPLQLIKPPEKILSESAGGNKKHTIRLGGQFQYAGRQNANGRIYEHGILEHAVKEIQEDISHRRVLGELDHPPDAKVHLDRVSHLITKLWMEDNTVYGELEVLGTTMGKELQALIDGGVTIGISSRGVGDMETTMHEGQELLKVLPGYTFVTFDIVAEPSVHGSYLSVMESRERLAGRGNNVRATREREILKEVKNLLSN
jgi:hypothetical protein